MSSADKVDVRLGWHVSKPAPPLSALALAKWKTIDLVDISVDSPFVTTQDISYDGRVIIPANTIMSGSRLSATEMCQPVRRIKTDWFFCLQDTDRDGRFDSFLQFWARDPTSIVMREYEFMIGRFTSYVVRPLPAPLPVSTLRQAAEMPPVHVRLMFQGAGNAHVKFGLCFYRGQGEKLGKGDLCATPFEIRIADLPVKRDVFGGQITIQSVADGKIVLSYDPPPSGAPVAGY